MHTKIDRDKEGYIVCEHGIRVIDGCPLCDAIDGKPVNAEDAIAVWIVLACVLAVMLTALIALLLPQYPL